MRRIVPYFSSSTAGERLAVRLQSTCNRTTGVGQWTPDQVLLVGPSAGKIITTSKAWARASSHGEGRLVSISGAFQCTMKIGPSRGCSTSSHQPAQRVPGDEARGEEQDVTHRSIFFLINCNDWRFGCNPPATERLVLDSGHPTRSSSWGLLPVRSSQHLKRGRERVHMARVVSSPSPGPSNAP
jgi:hypothetical protein